MQNFPIMFHENSFQFSNFALIHFNPLLLSFILVF